VGPSTCMSPTKYDQNVNNFRFLYASEHPRESHESSLGIVTKLRSGWLRNLSLIPGRG
jgi:hypothetical protein